MRRFLSFKRLSILFGALFVVSTGAMLVFQKVWLDEGERCEAKGYWYDLERRICAQPISIAEITGRPNGVSRAEASAEKNRELVDIERRLADQKRARDAATEAERERFNQR